MAGPREFFAALPARALGDDRLKGHHLRVLAAVALHDRFARNGRGCVASYDRLSAIAGCAYTRLSAAITDLVTWGYLLKERQADRRRAALSVIYQDLDKAFFEAGHWQETAPDSLPTGEPNGSPTGKLNGSPTGKEHGRKIVHKTGKVVHLSNPERQQNQQDGAHKRLGRNLRRDSAKAAPLRDATASRGLDKPTQVDSQNYPHMLRSLEKLITNGELEKAGLATVWQWWDLAEAIAIEAGRNTGLGEWARRLQGQLDELVAKLRAAR